MEIRIVPETKTAAFETDLQGCAAFAIENQGTTMVEVSFDKGESYVNVPPNGARPFPNIAGALYTGKLQGKFGGVVQDPNEPAVEPVDKVIVLKSKLICNR